MINSQNDLVGNDDVSRAIRAVTAESRLVVALRRADDLREAAMRSRCPAGDAKRLADLVRNGDDVSSLAALHALGAVADPLADRVLVDLALEAEEPFAAHAAWALAGRRSSAEAIGALVSLVVDGGFTAMLAERTLMEWSRVDARPTINVIQRMATTLDPTGRLRLAGLLTSLPGRATQHRHHSLPSLDRTATDGIVVVQPFLHTRLDRLGTNLGAGDAGGIASLLRSLGTVLAGVHDIDEVLSITRRHEDDAPWEQLSPGHQVVRIDVGPPALLPWRESWAYRVEIERQLVDIGKALEGRRVVWHLRMADVGSLAAASAARRLGQPVVFTAAPDPHIVIDALQDSGRLDRTRFGVEDAASQFWFRARMVERLTAQADRLTLLPRPTIVQELVDLVGVEPSDLAARATVIPEGVDVAEIERARLCLMSSGPSATVRRILDAQPAERRGLPWLLTVGRLNPAKGPQRLVEAVAANGRLDERVNVVVVGGDIEDPSPDERSTIERINRAARGVEPHMVTLTGHLPPASIADLMVYVAAFDGVYVCASDKEEFGLAIVEALAAGAVVVAPQRGGPRTYVVDGDTGVLCDTLSVTALQAALIRALALTTKPGRAHRARTKAAEELGIGQMAERLGEVYRALVPARVST